MLPRASTHACALIMKPVVLAIETSCDETAAAVYDGTVRSSVLFSQTPLHERYGGVVPEIASRSHIEKMPHIAQKALNEANISLDDIDVIAVTTKPGLPGSLLVGLSFAKALAFARSLPIIGINHLEGHVFSPFLEHTVPFPHLCLTASGGHTALFYIQNFGEYALVGSTHDDAAGEALDKIARLLQFPYPGGPHIEKLAAAANFQDFFHYPRMRKPGTDFSFSGLKTAVLYDLVERGWYDLKKRSLTIQLPLEAKQQIASSLLVCMGDILISRLIAAHKQKPDIQAITFVGGVSRNAYLRDRITTYATKCNLPVFIPSPEYCTDNAAMIAFVGAYKGEQGAFDDLTLDIF